jgi:hypothetical protein
MARVNEVALVKPMAIEEGPASVRRAGRADFTVLREGKTITFSVIVCRSPVA